MIKTLSERLHRSATGRNIAIFAALMALFAVVIVPLVQAKVEAYSGGTSLVDLKMSYTPQTLYMMIASYGDAGRSLYRGFAASGDLLYPVVYSLLLALLLSWLIQRSRLSSSKLAMLNVVPLGGMVFDWLENAHVITLLSLYPEEYPAFAKTASICTSLKWGFGAAGGLLLVIALVLAASNRFKRQ